MKARLQAERKSRVCRSCDAQSRRRVVTSPGLATPTKHIFNELIFLNLYSLILPSCFLFSSHSFYFLILIFLTINITVYFLCSDDIDVVYKVTCH